MKKVVKYIIPLDWALIVITATGAALLAFFLWALITHPHRVHAQAPALGSQLADEEILAGTIDGTNLTFGLAHIPYPWISLKLFRNGIRLVRCRSGVVTGCDYTLIAPYNQLTFVTVQTPQPGDILVADYRF